MSTDTEKLLEERGKSHGEYSEHADITQRLMDVIMSGRNWPHLPSMIRESLHMFAHKMGRVVTGDPCHPDHYDDIAGYAKLISQRMPVIREQYLQKLLLAAADKPGTPEDGGHHERDNRPLVYLVPKAKGIVNGDNGVIQLQDMHGMWSMWTSSTYEMIVEKEKSWEIHNPRSESLRRHLENIVSPNRQEI